MSNKNPSTQPRPRDRSETEKRIVAAAIELIRERGFDGIGISAVARRAELSKVLIYRYFGSFDGLLEVVGRELDPASIRDMSGLIYQGISEGKDLQEILKEAVPLLRKNLSEDELSLNLMAWEMTRENEVTKAFSRTREQAGLELNKILSETAGSDSNLDIEAIVTVVSSTVYYLLLRSKFVRHYNGLDLQNDQDWDRIAAALASLLKPY